MTFTRMMVVALAFGMLVPLASVAQKAKKDGLGYFNYVQPRMSSELDGFEYFGLEVEISDQDVYRRKQIEQYLSIEQYKVAGVENTPQFTIKVVESPFQFKSNGKKSYAQKYKEDGQEKSRTMHYYTGSMTYHYTMKVLSPEGEELFRDLVRGSETTKGRPSPSMTDAHDMYVQDKLKFKQNVLKSSSERLGKAFNNHFVDLRKAIHLHAVSIKEKKFEYPGFNAAYADLERCYAVLNVTNDGTPESEELLAKCIDFWTAFVQDATPSDSKSRKNAEVTAAAYYDLGLAYFFLQRYAEASENFAQAATYDKGVVPGIKNMVAVSSDCADRQSGAQK